MSTGFAGPDRTLAEMRADDARCAETMHLERFDTPVNILVRDRRQLLERGTREPWRSFADWPRSRLVPCSTRWAKKLASAGRISGCNQTATIAAGFSTRFAEMRHP